MVMGMVRGREKGGIADIETLDIDNFAHLVTGQRAKWLWLGKPRKSGIDDGFASGPPAADMMFTTDDHGGYVWTSRRRQSNEDLAGRRSLQGSDHSWKHETADTLDEKDQNLGRMMRKGVSGKVTDARIGFGRFKDAVGLPGLRSHHHKPSKEGVDMLDAAFLPTTDNETDASKLKHAADIGEVEHDDVHDVEPHEDEEKAGPSSVPKSYDAPPEIVVEPVTPVPGSQSPGEAPERPPLSNKSDEDDHDLELCRTRSTEVSNDREHILSQAAMALRRPRSYMDLNQDSYFQRKDNYWPRHLSFSTVEEVVLTWECIGGKDMKEKPGANLEEAIAHEEMLGSDTRLFSSRILELSQNTVPWVERQVDAVDDLNQILYDRHEEISTIYHERLGTYQKVRERSSDILTDEHSYLMDHMKRVELLGAKLDYELNVLGSKVEDVESGLAEFERHVIDIESRVGAIKGEQQKQSGSWLNWFGRFAGLSTQ